MLRRLRRAAAVAGTAACAALGWAATASATTLGATTLGNVGCSNGVWSDDAISYAAPSTGALVSFSVDQGSTGVGDPVDFLALRPTGGGNYTVVGHSGTQTIAGAGLNTFALTTPIFVQAGDAIGEYGGLPNCATASSGLHDLIFAAAASDPADGSSLAMSEYPPLGEVNEAADWEPTTPLDTSSSSPVSTPTLTNGVTYKVSIGGTYSAFNSTLMSGGVSGWVVCGTPEAAPQFGSGGAVGQDAEYTFARPWSKHCPKNTTYPVAHDATHPAVKFDTGDGQGMQRIAPDTDSAAYNPQHVYTYTVVGDGHPLQVQLMDSNYSDNYGDLEIVAVQPAT